MSTRQRLAFPIKLSSPPGTITLHISDPSKIQADNLALATWGSSQVLANLLHRLPVPSLPETDSASQRTLVTPVDNVVELGAGTGIVGLAAAIVWKTALVLTDLEPILANIRANIVLNRDLLAQHGGSAEGRVLDWADPDHEPDGAPPRMARVMLAADTVYSEEHPELLTRVIAARLERGPDAQVVLCYPLRIGYLDHIRDLWERLEGVGLECVEEGREALDEEWEEDTPYEWCIWRWRSETLKRDPG